MVRFLIVKPSVRVFSLTWDHALTPDWITVTTIKKIYRDPFKIPSSWTGTSTAGGRSMVSINRSDHFLLTKLVKKTDSQNRLTEAVSLKMTASINKINKAAVLNQTPRLIY